MKISRLLLSALLVFRIPSNKAECKILQTYRGVVQYSCDTIRDLEEQSSPEMKDVSVFRDQLAPVVSTSTFRNSPNLQRLTMERSVSAINRGAFHSLKDLSMLSINYNDLNQLQPGVFSSLPLEYLDLSDNSIVYVDPGTFFNLTNLKTLQFRRNRLSRVLKGVFSDFPAVERLSLSQNKIRTLEEACFANMPNLKRLHLDGNLLTEFQAEAVISHKDNLQNLWLHNNSFKEVNRDTVRGLKNLKVLNLQDNAISKIRPYTLENVNNLVALVLSNNSLETLDFDIFPEEGMPKLVNLYVNDNRMSYLSTKVLGRLVNLKGIRLGGNPWQCPCIDMIMVWLNDHEVKLSCDQDYYSGRRPLCVVVDTHPNTCVYENDKVYYQTYMETISKLPKTSWCLL